MLRETDVKDICVNLAKAGEIEKYLGQRQPKAAR